MVFDASSMTSRGGLKLGWVGCFMSADRMQVLLSCAKKLSLQAGADSCDGVQRSLSIQRLSTRFPPQ
jgi:hypothetical protein